MFGPDGTVGSAGAAPRPGGTSLQTRVTLSFSQSPGSPGPAPRPGGTSLQTRVTLSFSQSHGSPVVALMRSLPATRAFAAPVIPSATHSSIASSLTLRNASFEPSGENLT